MTQPAMSIDEALVDEHLLGAALEGNIAPWQTWRVALKGAFGLPLNDKECVVFSAIAGGRNPPAKRVRELWCVVGRKGGKSKIAGALATYFALFVPHKLSRGEKGLVLVLAASRDQAQVVFDYIRGYLEASPVLAQEVLDMTRTEIRLRNGVTIAVHANSYRTVRGRTLLACVFDETAFWRDETSAVPDREVYTAILPTMMMTGGMLISISTPYRKLGLLHQKWRDHFGQDDDDVLVVQGASSTFNPLLTPEVIAAQRAADPEGALAELDAEFRSDSIRSSTTALSNGPSIMAARWNCRRWPRGAIAPSLMRPAVGMITTLWRFHTAKVSGVLLILFVALRRRSIRWKPRRDSPRC